MPDTLVRRVVARWVGSAVLMILTTPGTAQAASLSGWRLEALAGSDRLSVRTHYAGKSTLAHDNGRSFGASLGYDRQFGPIVVGIESGATLANASACIGGAAQLLCFKPKTNFDIAARTGVAFGRKVLVYGRVGYVAARTKLILTSSVNPLANVVQKDARKGLELGGGAQFNIVGGLFLKAEYRQTDYNDYRVMAGASRAQVGLTRGEVLAGAGVHF